MHYKDYVKWARMPTTWCPGCAIGIVFKQLAFTLADMKIPRSKLAVVSGIGCSGRAAGYFNVDSVHSTHGRAIPMAEGIKRGNPRLNVIVFSGDGDLAGELRLEFTSVDEEVFPSIRWAREAGARGDGCTCALNAANEVAVRAFLDGVLAFLGIFRVVERVLEESAGGPVGSYEDAVAVDAWARERAARSASSDRPPARKSGR